jgi:hypothetical protein
LNLHQQERASVYFVNPHQKMKTKTWPTLTDLVEKGFKSSDTQLGLHRGGSGSYKIRFGVENALLNVFGGPI